MTTSSQSETLHSSRFPLALIVIFIFVLTTMTFVNAVNADFVNWDDDAYVTENPLVQSLSPASIVEMFTTSHFYSWVPLTLLSHAVDVALWGMSPKGHHLTNVLLHSCNAVMLFLACFVLMKTLKHHGANGFSGEHPSILVGSVIAALLFALHPLRVESVAWVSGRKDLLCAFFLLPSFFSYLLWRQKSRRWVLNVSIVLFACALLAKPSALAFPVVLLLVDILLLKHEDETNLVKNLFTDKILFFLLSAVVGCITLMAAGTGKVNVVAELSLLERIALPAYMFTFYLWKTLIPVNLSPVYPELDTFILTLSILAAIGALGGFWMLLKKKQGAIPLAFFGYILFLFPILFGLSSGLQPLADRYSYIATMSIFMLIAAVIEWLWRTSAASQAKKYRRAMLFGVLIAICALSCYQAIRHVAVWSNSVTLWTQAARYVPATREQYEQRRPYMRPNHLDALINLGTAYYAGGNTGAALDQFRRMLLLDDRSADAHYNIGNLLYEKGDVDGSIVSLEKAVALDSLYAKAHYNLGIILVNKGEPERALKYLQTSARLGFADAQRLLQQQGLGW
jgi:protein O-mannosyl-transferase